MDYDTAVDALFRLMPEDAPPPPSTVGAGPARRLRDALEPLSQHSVWSAHVNAVLADAGMDFVTGVVCGRAAALGEAAPAVVVATFGSWEPATLTALYESGRGICSRADLLTIRQSAGEESLAAVLGDADVEPVVRALRRTVNAVDATGRPLFAGFRALPWPENSLGALWRACEALRERRGDSHVVAYTALGLRPLDMHSLLELWLGTPAGSHSGIYGWSEAAIAASYARLEEQRLATNGALTAEGVDLREGIEATTDALEAPVVDALGVDFEPVVTALDEWSAACVAAGAYPPDPYRRAGA